VLGVPDARAAQIAAEYPLDAYASPALAFSALLGDANFACTALQQNEWTSPHVPTFAYEFNDDMAPPRYWPPNFLDPPVATHGSELPYLFDQPQAPFKGPLDPDQERLASSMRAAWANFAASGDPVDGRIALAVVRRQRAGDVARATPATDRDGLRRAAPLFLLGHRMIKAPLAAAGGVPTHRNEREAMKAAPT
jgi:carboxylesterase type B